MAYETTSLKDYYFLRKWESFSIDPWRDSEVYFGEAELLKRISDRIESDFAKRRAVPKFFLFGAYGCGKTHSLAHIKYTLEKNQLYPAMPIYVAMPPLTSKDHWLRIHTKLLDSIGPDRIRSAMEIMADKIQGTDKVKGLLDNGILPFGDDTMKISQSNALRNFLFGGRQSQLSWEWMRGRKNSAEQAAVLGVQKDITEATDFVNCLLNLGSLIRNATSKKLVFLIDEAEAVKSVTNADSLHELQQMLRDLLDDNNNCVGLIFAIQVEGGQEEIGEVFTRGDIQRRVDFDQGYIDLTPMVSQITSAEQFMCHVLAYLVEQDKAQSAITDEGLIVSKERFPFSDEAIKAIATHIADKPEWATPAFILATMSTAAVEAWRKRSQSDKHVIVDTEIIESTIYPGG
ncbi:MAG: DUF2791 family P-loop domain-containing protein [Chloroflexi bacterium]|nr:DUF2791 family P-loop domain-containing protein [Chloroflexota bacterium]